MKKILGLMSILLIVIGVVTFGAGDDLEGLLMSDESTLEEELLKEEEKTGDLIEGQVKELVGQAVMRNQEEEIWKQIFTGMKVKEGSTVVTMEKSEVKIELLNGSVVDLRPKTQAFFKTMRQNPEEKELTETGIKLFMGKVYSNVKKLVDTGSKYEVETSSATAGVRGTKFTVSVDENGETETEVYEGVVEFAPISSPGDFVQVNANERVRASSDGVLSPKEAHNNEPPESIEQDSIEETGEQVEEEGEAEDKKVEEEKEDSSGSGYGVQMEAGTKVVNDLSYGTLEINPDFNNIFGTPIGLGLKITILQGQDGDEKVTKYGPGASDDWYEALSLRWAEYNGEIFGLRYGELGSINYGHGLLMENYTTFGLKTRLSLKNNRLYAFGPLKEAPTTGRDNLYGARYERRLVKGLFGGVTYLQDLDENVEDSEKLPSSAIGIDSFYEFSNLLIPYVEYDMLQGFGNGYEGGIRGGISFLNYKVGYRNIGDEFEPTLYDQFYETRKFDILSEADGALDLGEVEGYSGYIGQLGLNIFSLANIQMRYEDYPDKELKRLKGDLSVSKMSFLPGMWSRIEAGAAYKQIDVDFEDFEWLNKDNTSVYGYVVYPASGSVDVKIEYIKEPGKEEYTSFRTIISF